METSREITERYNNADYLEKNRDWHAGGSPWKATQVARLLADHAIAPETVAEVGCGAGEILVNLRRMGVGRRFDGYELSEDAFAICSPKAEEGADGSGLAFHFENLAASDRRFDVLLCMDVFEHVEDYIGFVRGLGPRAEWKVFHIPLDLSASAILRGRLMDARKSVGHLHYFTAETAVATIEDAGLEVVDRRFTAPFARDGVVPEGLKSRIAAWPRRLLHAMSPGLLSRTIGGCSLLVLAR